MKINFQALFLGLSLMLCSISMLAQTGVVTTGSDLSGPGGSVSYSVGQSDYRMIESADGTVAEGLQQPVEIYVITGLEIRDINLELSVYPNPTSGKFMLNIQNREVKNMQYILSAVQGNIIAQHKLDTPLTEISLDGAAPGTYLLKVLNGNEETKVFRIIKNW